MPHASSFHYRSVAKHHHKEGVMNYKRARVYFEASLRHRFGSVAFARCRHLEDRTSALSRRCTNSHARAFTSPGLQAASRGEPLRGRRPYPCVCVSRVSRRHSACLPPPPAAPVITPSLKDAVMLDAGQDHANQSSARSWQ